MGYGRDGKVTGTREQFSAPGTGWTSAFRKVVFHLEKVQVDHQPGWKRCLRDLLHQRHIHFSPSWVLQLPPSSEIKGFTFDSCQQKWNPSSPPPLCSGLWQHLKVAAKPWQLRLMETVLSSLFHSSPAFKSQLHELYLKYMLFSIHREAANQKTSLFSDCFKKTVYFTLPNTGAREELTA